VNIIGLLCALHGKMQDAADKLGCASAIENKFSWHSACASFKIKKYFVLFLYNLFNFSADRPIKNTTQNYDTAPLVFPACGSVFNRQRRRG